MPFERRADVRRIIERIGAGEPIQNFKMVRRDKSRKLIDVSMNVSPVKAPDGTIIGVAKIVRKPRRFSQGKSTRAETLSR